MKSKREMLKHFVRKVTCNIPCSECPYKSERCLVGDERLARIGAMALLRMFPEKREFDKSKILTCVTADKAKVGMRGYFGNSIKEIENKFHKNISFVLERISEDVSYYVFDYTDGVILSYPLFYPIDEVEE